MDTSNWRPNQGGSGGGGDSSMESVDWRTQLPADTRQKIVNKTMDIFKNHLSFAGQEKLHEVKNIALRFEEKIYYAATSHSDYMGRIYIKLLAMENRTANPIANSLQSTSAGTGVNPSDPGPSSSTQECSSRSQTRKRKATQPLVREEELAHVVAHVKTIFDTPTEDGDMDACMLKLDRLGWEGPLYDVTLYLFSQGIDYRKIWLRLKDEKCESWIRFTALQLNKPITL